MQKVNLTGAKAPHNVIHIIVNPAGEGNIYTTQLVSLVYADLCILFVGDLYTYVQPVPCELNHVALHYVMFLFKLSS